MRITTALLAILVSGLLSGCASAPTEKMVVGRPVPYWTFQTATQKCGKGGNCLVRVTVDPTQATSDNPCGINVPDQVVKLGGPNNGTTRRIIWVIVADGYVFSTDSSVPALNVKGSTNFTMPSVAGPVMVDIVNVSSDGLSHEYGLNIVKPDGTKCPQYDPWVIE